jgi:hypothetical protein
MQTQAAGDSPKGLEPERVAYWYFRLNGFLQIENFIIHDRRSGGQRTDADLFGVRFPYRGEFLADLPERPMPDDQDRLGLSDQLIDVVIAEVKTNQPCALNGPWTRKERENVQRALLAIGCIDRRQVEQAAGEIYEKGIYTGASGLRVRLVAVGRNRDAALRERYPAVTQVTWIEALAFVWDRLTTYAQFKKQVDEWDFSGKQIKALAEASGSFEQFVSHVAKEMNVDL